MQIREFVRARLDEDEAQARDAASRNAAEWTCPASAVLDIGDDDLVLVHDSGVGEHMRRHDPAHVLLDVAAKRKLLEQCCHTLDYEDYGWVMAEFALNALAAPYAEHPDFDPAWRLEP